MPPSGGTISYAGIVQQRGGLPEDGPQIPSPIIELPSTDDAITTDTTRIRGSAHSAGSHDEFVDARESFGPPSSPRASRTSGKKAPPTAARSALSAYGSRKTGEELEGENAALRQLLDTQSRVLEKQGRRLQMWEAQSQSQTAAAMAQSFMAGRAGATVGSGPSAARKPPAAVSREPSSASVDGAMSASDAAAKIAALEAKLASETAARQEMEKSELKTKAENAKLQTVVGKYRERWEVLKQGARERQSKKAEEVNAAETRSRKGSEAKEKELGLESPGAE